MYEPVMNITLYKSAADYFESACLWGKDMSIIHVQDIIE